jgi:NADH dehydrogenase/NADH:ubiquinone oxidoreductase subunit G
MTRVYLNGIAADIEEGATLLEAAHSLGIEIPTLCFHPGLSAYGACRLCVVELGDGRLVSACTYPVQEGLRVRTHSPRVQRARRMLIELLLSICPDSKRIQDLAVEHHVERVRFSIRRQRCILCGLCVRMCAEQMRAHAIGFVNRGYRRRVTTPFDLTSEACRRCGGCLYICPVCELRCHGPEAPDVVCGSCAPPAPTCPPVYDDLACCMGAAGECGTCVRGPRTSALRSPDPTTRRESV